MNTIALTEEIAPSNQQSKVRSDVRRSRPQSSALMIRRPVGGAAAIDLAARGRLFFIWLCERMLTSLAYTNHSPDISITPWLVVGDFSSNGGAASISMPVFLSSQRNNIETDSRPHDPQRRFTMLIQFGRRRELFIIPTVRRPHLVLSFALMTKHQAH
jgi:hypothetical protein